MRKLINRNKETVGQGSHVGWSENVNWKMENSWKYKCPMMLACLQNDHSDSFISSFKIHYIKFIYL